MDYELMYQISNAIVLVPWMLMIFLPRGKVSDWVVYTYFVPLLLGLAYVVLFSQSLSQSNPEVVNFTTLEGLMGLFQSKGAVLAGWLHYLAFDMVVGIWIVKNAQKYGIPHLWVIPCLLLCFMAGPTGFVLYWLVRRLRRVPLIEA